MSRSFLTLAAAFAILTSAAAFAAPVTYNVDQVHSSVNFEIRHLFSKVRGKFSEFSGSINYDAAKVTDSTVNFTVKTDSVNTDNPKRDGHLKSPDFFDTAKFQTLEFKSTKVVAAGKDKMKVTGDLTIHGVTKPTTFDVELLGAGKGMDGKPVASFQATATINRKDFGIVWNKVLDAGSTALGDDVKLEILVEADKADAAQAAKAK